VRRLIRYNLVAASDNNFIFSVQPFFGPAEARWPQRTIYFPNVGDQLTSKSVTWTWSRRILKRRDLGYVAAQNRSNISPARKTASTFQDLTNFFAHSTTTRCLPWSSCNLDGAFDAPRIWDVMLGLNWLPTPFNTSNHRRLWSETRS